MIIDLNKQLEELYTKFPLFGIILFTEVHPHVIKALKDPDYYDALDKITSKQIAIFTTMLFKGEYKYPKPPSGVLAHMIPIWQEPHENTKMLSWFNLEDSKDFPLFIIFGIDNNELYHQKHSIKDNSPKEVFKNLQKVIYPICDQIRENSHIDKKALFKKAQWEIKKLQAKQKAEELLGVVSSFRGFSGI